MLAFANFGTALRSTGADSSKSKGTGGSNAVLDYSKQELSLSSEARDQVCFCLLHGTTGAVCTIVCKLNMQCRGDCRLWDLDPGVNTHVANLHCAACCSAGSVLLCSREPCCHYVMLKFGPCHVLFKGLTCQRQSSCCRRIFQAQPSMLCKELPCNARLSLA